MSLDACIASLEAKGDLDAERAKAFRDYYNELRRDYRRTMSAIAADAAATRETVTAVERQMAESRRQTLLQLKVQQGIVQATVEHLARGGTAAEAALAHFGIDDRTPGIANLEARKRSIVGQAHAQLSALLAKFSHDLAGRARNPALMANVVRERFGQDSGDLAAKELAKAAGDTFEFLRQRFNAAGGHIGVRGDWGLPQAHYSIKVRQVDYATWRDFTRPLLDPARMMDGETGLPLTGARLEKALQNTYESIRTEGWDDRAPGGAGRPKLGNLRAEHRFLVFRDADSWMAYQQRFGLGSAWDAMLGHIDYMARDIAQLEILGPSPGHTVRWMGDLLEKDAQTSAATGKEFDRLLRQARGARSQIERMMAVFTGEVNRPVNAAVARGFSTFRSIQTAAKLGGAVISAVTDLGFQNVTANFNGLSSARILGNYLRLLTSQSDRDLAVASGLIAEEAASRMGSVWRYDDSVNTPEVARRLSSGVLRLSGLSAWTQAGKWAFGMEFMHALGRAAQNDWEALPKPLAEALARHGIDSQDWTALRGTPLFEHRGAKFLRPDEIADPQLATRVLEMIQTETLFAVPEATLRSRAVMTGGREAGTVAGELWRSVMQFKAFPVSILMTHGRRIVEAKGLMAKARYAANLALATTVMGALATQLKQVADGKDPRDMDQPGFWVEAMWQGGGLGILGDFARSSTSRAQGSIYETALGPLAGTTADLLAATGGNLGRALRGENTNAGRQVAKLLRDNTPGSSLWYVRLALNRILWDEVQRELDPDAEAAFHRLERRARKDYDQQYWWAPGESAPERAPDLEAIDGGSP